MIDARPAPHPAIAPDQQASAPGAHSNARKDPAAAAALHAELSEDLGKASTAFALSTAMSTMQVSCRPLQPPSYSPKAGMWSDRDQTPAWDDKHPSELAPATRSLCQGESRHSRAARTFSPLRNATGQRRAITDSDGYALGHS